MQVFGSFGYIDTATSKIQLSSLGHIESKVVEWSSLPVLCVSCRVSLGFSITQIKKLVQEEIYSAVLAHSASHLAVVSNASTSIFEIIYLWMGVESQVR